jgi:hypothetical protein
LKEDEENFHAKENSRLHSEVDALSVRLIDALNLLDVARNQIKKEEQKQQPPYQVAPQLVKFFVGIDEQLSNHNCQSDALRLTMQKHGVLDFLDLPEDGYRNSDRHFLPWKKHPKWD